MIDAFFCYPHSFWALVADSLSPHDAEQLADDLGIEHDTPEHVELERGPLCGVSASKKALSNKKLKSVLWPFDCNEDATRI